MCYKKFCVLLSLLLICISIGSCNTPPEQSVEPTEEEQIIAAIKAGGDVVLPEDVSYDKYSTLSALIRDAAPYQKPITSIKFPSDFGVISDITVYNQIDTLVNFYVSEDDPNYISVDGVVYTKDKSRLVLFPAGRTGEFTLPDTTEEIYNGAFAGTELTSVYIPDSVYSIGMRCFENSDTIEKISLPKEIRALDACFPSHFIGSASGLPNSAQRLNEGIIIEYRGTYEEWQQTKRNISVDIPEAQLICTDFDGTVK